MVHTYMYAVNHVIDGTYVQVTRTKLVTMITKTYQAHEAGEGA